MLIEMADYYEVDLRELLDGERKSEEMNKEMEETVLKVADYSNEEKNRLMKNLHFFFLDRCNCVYYIYCTGILWIGR